MSEEFKGLTLGRLKELLEDALAQFGQGDEELLIEEVDTAATEEAA